MNDLVLITDKMHASIIEMLRSLGLKPDYLPEISREEIKKILPNYVGLMVRSKTKIDEELLAQGTSLKFVARAGSGLDNIDQAAAQKRNIQVYNAPEGNRDAVAEHTMGMILSLLHNIRKGDAEVRNYHWDREANRGRELSTKTVGIVGYGNIGHELAKRLRSFNCEILAYDKFKFGFGNDYVREVDLDGIFEKSDIVTFHIPLLKETRYMVNHPFLEKFKNNIFLINTARGELIDLDALIGAIESGKVLGACLDVLENEKLKTLNPAQKERFDYLIQSDKIILTPHVAGWTYESYQRINQVLVKKIQACLADLSVNES